MSTAEGSVRAKLAPLALIAAGGSLGAILRYLLARGLPSGVPVGTLAANVFGAFLLGIVLYDAHLAEYLSARTRLFVGTGFCSSLTTYSTFALETAQLSPALASANVVANYFLGFAGILLGQAITRWLA